MAVFFHFNEVHPVLKDRRRLKAFLQDFFLQQGFSLHRLDYIFCNDSFLLKMNTQFLQHQTLTDILTFDLSENPAEKLAEIYISVDRVAANALKFGVPFDQELHRVIFHGVLHLCGFGDKTPVEKKQMRSKENELLERYLTKF